MAIKSYIPSVSATVKVAVAMMIVFGLMKFLPIPENIRSMFRI